MGRHRRGAAGDGAGAFTFSIAAGIGLGFIAYCAVKLLTGRWREIGPGVAIIALAFTAKVALT